MTRRSRDQKTLETVEGGHGPTLGLLDGSAREVEGIKRAPRLARLTQHQCSTQSLGGHALSPLGHGVGGGWRRAPCHLQGPPAHAGPVQRGGDEPRQTHQAGHRLICAETPEVLAAPNSKGARALHTRRQDKDEQEEGSDEQPRAHQGVGGRTPWLDVDVRESCRRLLHRRKNLRHP